MGERSWLGRLTPTGILHTFAEPVTVDYMLETPQCLPWAMVPDGAVKRQMRCQVGLEPFVVRRFIAVLAGRSSTYADESAYYERKASQIGHPARAGPGLRRHTTEDPILNRRKAPAAAGRIPRITGVGFPKVLPPLLPE
jgi:hypothetical protein